MAVEKELLNIDKDGSIDIEIAEAMAGAAPQPPMSTEVQLPEEMNVQGELTSAFEIDQDGNVVPMFEQEEVTVSDHQANLAESLDSSDLSTLASELLEAYDSDKDSRQDWLDTFSKGLELLGIKTEEREAPFPGATGVHHPLLAESDIRIQSQAISEIFPASGPASTKIVGDVVKKLDHISDLIDLEEG